MTVEYMSVENKRYTIDLVPAIEFNLFPEPASDWTCSWIPEENVENIRKRFHVVTKVHETGEYSPASFVYWSYLIYLRGCFGQPLDNAGGGYLVM